VIIRVGCTLAERSWVVVMVGADNGIRIGRGRVLEESRVAEIVGQLAAHLDAGEQGVLDLARVRSVGCIGLVEEVEPLGRVVIGGERVLRFVRAHRARYEVLVSAIVAAKGRSVCERSHAPLAAGRLIDPRFDGGADATDVRIAEICRDRHIDRFCLGTKARRDRLVRSSRKRS